MSSISVIIPTYGEPKYLKDAIESVINQTFKDWSLIVVDDNDPDTLSRQKTEKVLEQYNNYENIKYIKHDKNKNGAAARNTGLKYVNSKYVAFLGYKNAMMLWNRINIQVLQAYTQDANLEEMEKSILNM